jgi:hypothetical protein
LDAFDSAISHHLSSMASSVFLRMIWRSIHTFWSGLLRLYLSMEVFLNQVVLRNWKDSIKALQSCEVGLPHAEAYTAYSSKGS